MSVILKPLLKSCIFGFLREILKNKHTLTVENEFVQFTLYTSFSTMLDVFPLKKSGCASMAAGLLIGPEQVIVMLKRRTH